MHVTDLKLESVEYKVEVQVSTFFAEKSEVNEASPNIGKVSR